MSTSGSAAVLLAALLGPPPLPHSAQVLRPIWDPSGNYAESFTFVADLDDGTYVQLTLSITNLGPGTSKGICRAVVAAPAAPAWKGGLRVSRDEWGFAARPEEKLTVGPCSARAAGEATSVEAQVEGGRVALSYAAPPRRLEPPASVLTVGDDRYHTEILLYGVPVQATVALPGAEPRTGAGMGYADHSRSTVAPKDLASRWVRFRGLRGRPLLLLGRESRDGKFAPLWSSAEPGRWREYARFEVERGGAGKAPTFRVRVEGAEGQVEIRSRALLYRDAPVEDLGLLGKVVAPFAGSPVTYVYRGVASGAGESEVEGILEVELSPE